MARGAALWCALFNLRCLYLPSSHLDLMAFLIPVLTCVRVCVYVCLCVCVCVCTVCESVSETEKKNGIWITEKGGLNMFLGTSSE